MMAWEEKPLSVREITLRIKRLLESEIHPLWVEGEISNFKRHRSGHLYFSLKDDWAQIQCVMFRSSASRLRFNPEHGMLVRVFGRIGVYEKYGGYQIYVERMEPSGLGMLHLAFEQLKKKLAAEGLFDESRKRPLPRFPRRIGVVTSDTGAAIRDIVDVISRRFPPVEIVLCPARVQGDGAWREIASAVRTFEKLPAASRPDVLIVGRGGGSLEDLWAFNEEGLARVIAACSIPVISAVGHEIDFTICDFVADKRAPTPSAAAELAVPDREELLRSLSFLQERLSQSILRRIEIHQLKVRRYEDSSLFHPERLVREYSMRLDTLENNMINGMGRNIRFMQRKLAKINTRLLVRGPQAAIAAMKSEFTETSTRFLRTSEQHFSALRNRFERCHEKMRRFTLNEHRMKFEVLKAHFSGFDPKAILKRGYAICMKDDGTIVSACRQVERGEPVSVEVSDGHFNCRIEGKECHD